MTTYYESAPLIAQLTYATIVCLISFAWLVFIADDDNVICEVLGL